MRARTCCTSDAQALQKKRNSLFMGEGLLLPGRATMEEIAKWQDKPEKQPNKPYEHHNQPR